MIIKITLKTDKYFETYASTWQEALEYTLRNVMSWAGINDCYLKTVQEDRKMICDVLEVVNGLTEDQLAEIHPLLIGTYFKIEKLKVTPLNEQVFDYLWKYRCRGGINNGWVRKPAIKNDLNIEKVGGLTGTLTGFMRKGIIENQNIELPDGETLRFYRIARAHTFNR